MTCGCQTVPSDTAAARGAMCATCPHGERVKGVTVKCSLNGMVLPGAAIKKSSVCPIGRWPQVTGMVAWRGRTWIGVPDPLRWLIALRLGREPNVPGCGCRLDWKMSRWGGWIDGWLSNSHPLRQWVIRVVQGWRACWASIKTGP